MYETKKIGDWTLLETEISSFFTRYAERAEIGSDYYKNYNKNIFENVLLPAFRETQLPMRTAIDVGASYGFVAEGLLQNFESVHAFELVTPIRECLRINLGDNPKITIHDCGLGSESGLVKSIFYPAYTGHCSMIDMPGLKITQEELVSSMARMDDFNFTDVDFVKIDVEGYELEVLKGARNTLMSNDTLVLVEILKTNENAVENAIRVGQLMSSYGYELLLNYQEDFLFGKMV